VNEIFMVRSTVYITMGSQPGRLFFFFFFFLINDSFKGTLKVVPQISPPRRTGAAGHPRDNFDIIAATQRC